MSFAAVLLITLAGASAPAAQQSLEQPVNQQPTSSTVIGDENPLLTRGAQALIDGQAEEGVRLTLEGLKLPAPPRNIAAAHANLCAGYVLLHRYDEALAQCNTAIELDATNWRAFNNRAAVFSAQGLYEKAIEDVLVGLKISPSATVLHQSLTIIYQNQKVRRSHSRSGSTA
jgi:tetratricopeptide (TPR) repeat protein